MSTACLAVNKSGVTFFNNFLHVCKPVRDNKFEDICKWSHRSELQVTSDDICQEHALFLHEAQ